MYTCDETQGGVYGGYILFPVRALKIALIALSHVSQHACSRSALLCVGLSVGESRNFFFF